MHSSGLAMKNALLTGEGGKIVAGLGGHALKFCAIFWCEKDLQRFETGVEIS